MSTMTTGACTSSNCFHTATMTTEKNDCSTSSRVPAALQSVFLAANRGKEVSKPPPNQMACRTFRRRFFPGRAKFGMNSSFSSTASATDLDSSNSSLSFSIHEAETPCTSGRSSRHMFLASPRAQAKGSVDMHGFQPFPKSSSRRSLDTSAQVQKPPTTHHVSPQSYCTSLLKTRGYCTSSFSSIETSYYNKPTTLQVASYGLALTELIKSGKVRKLRELLDLGLSPNACNTHGESIVHMVCRYGNKECLEALLSYGASVQIADDYGRTPLHDACFCREPNFELVDLILACDRHLLFIEDCKGTLPLSYLRHEQWTAWTKYLMSRKDRFWPDRDIKKDGFESDPPLALERPNTRPVPDPKNALALELLRMVANKRMDPIEAALLKDDFCELSSCSDGSTVADLSCSMDDDFDSDDDDDDDSTSEADGDDDERYDGYDCYDDDSSDSSGAFDESELEQILGCISRGKAIAWSS